jgi:hypothetical protein
VPCPILETTHIKPMELGTTLQLNVLLLLLLPSLSAAA